MLNKFTFLFLFFICQSVSAWEPSKTIEVIVPFPPASGNDFIIRTLIPVVEQNTGTKFNVINKPGAGGTVGTASFVNKPNDGHHIIIISVGGIAAIDYTWPIFFNNPPYQIDSFTYATALAQSSAVIIANKNDYVSSPKEFVDVLLKEKNITIADSGGAGRLALETILLNIDAKMKNPSIIRIEHKGPSETIMDISGNHIRFGSLPLSVAYSHHINGKIKIIGVIRQSKVDNLDFENFRLINKNIESNLVWGIALPKNTPKEILDWYSKIFNEAQSDPKVKEIFHQNQYFSIPNLQSTEQFTKYVFDENKKYQSIIKTIVQQSNSFKK